MAEGWCRQLWGDEFDAYSAGTKKHGMNARAIKVMQEAGIDISKQYSKTIDELTETHFDIIITVCDAAKEACPYFPGGTSLHMSFQDPPSLTKEMENEEEILKVYRRVRDEMQTFMKDLKNRI
jgi:arsenate reductase